jgi:ATP-dependent exoDNAse (exonuclease V) alpha subunit
MTQQDALDLLKLGYNVFLTGPAGSGKTYLLNQYISYLEEHGVGVAVTASTGIAATHLEGQTIHSWSGIGVRDSLADDELSKIISNKRIERNLKKTKVLVIDEVSMLHPHQLDMVERVMRHALDFTKPFGGVQVILSGDFFQLPPVSREDRGGGDKKFAYECDSWNGGDFKICYLHEQFRQQEDELLTILNTIRSGKAGENVKVPLRTRYKKDPTYAKASAGKARMSICPTKLYARNMNVDQINQVELEKLEGVEKTFYMQTHGFSTLVDALKRNCLAPEELHLKIGAEVMFVKNSISGAYVNGTRAVVVDFDKVDRWPIVETFSGQTITVQPDEWRLEENGTVRATLTQVPLRLAWAITIHKSQGMTLDSAEIDLSDAFEPGMGYVALSRVRTLAGLKLMGLNDTALSVHPKILTHDKKFQEWSVAVSEALQSFSAKEKQKQHDEVLTVRFGGTKEADVLLKTKTKKTRIKVAKKPTQEITKEFLEKKVSLEDIAKERGVTIGTILSHLEKLQGVGELPDINYLKPKAKDFKKIMAEFKKSDDGKLTPIFGTLKGEYPFEILRLVRLFVE